MPIYAYRCAACGHAKDVLQRMSDPLLTVCPACGADTFRKQLTAAGFQLKGSGWYVTDFKGGTGAPAAASDAKAEPADKGADKGADKADAAASGSPAAAPAAAAAPASSPAPAPAGPASTAP